MVGVGVVVGVGLLGNESATYVRITTPSDSYPFRQEVTLNVCVPVYNPETTHPVADVVVLSNLPST